MLYMGRIFKNPTGSPEVRKFGLATLYWILSRIFTLPYKLGIDLPIDHILPRDKALSLLNKYKDIPSVTWLGHATFLFRIGNVQILTDPILFGNAGPSWIRGLKRLPNPLQTEDLADAHVLLISHEHLDHLHTPSLKSLLQKSNIQPITPLGVGRKMRKHGFKKAVELDWFEKYQINNEISITALPALHYSDFWSRSLWAGFVISFKDNSGMKKKIYFGGDTGYGPFIKKDIAPYGPFDLACIGVGAFYLPFPSRAPLAHTNPEQAIQIAKDINAKKIIGMHWGTIKMADEDPNELLPRMKKHAQEIDYMGDIIMLHMGETIQL